MQAIILSLCREKSEAKARKEAALLGFKDKHSLEKSRGLFAGFVKKLPTPQPLPSPSPLPSIPRESEVTL